MVWRGIFEYSTQYGVPLASMSLLFSFIFMIMNSPTDAENIMRGILSSEAAMLSRPCRADRTEGRGAKRQERGTKLFWSPNKLICLDVTLFLKSKNSIVSSSFFCLGPRVRFPPGTDASVILNGNVRSRNGWFSLFAFGTIIP
jgi:hypothetical protein